MKDLCEQPSPVDIEGLLTRTRDLLKLDKYLLCGTALRLNEAAVFTEYVRCETYLNTLPGWIRINVRKQSFLDT